MRRVAWLAIVLCGFAVALAPRAATAQRSEERREDGGEARPEDASSEAATERARALFAEAIELADAGDWERAVHRFQSALELRDAPTIRYNLASSLARLNRIRQALDELDRVDEAGDTDEPLREQAAALRASLAPRLGRLTVVVVGDTVGTHLTVDGAPWEHAGVAAPANPGIVVARLWRGDDELDREDVDLPDGGEARVELRVPSPVLESGSDGIVMGETGGSAGSDDGLAIGLGVGGGVLVVAAAILVTFFVLDAQVAASSMGDFMPGVLVID